MREELLSIKDAALSLIVQANSRQTLYEVKVQYWGKNGKLTDAMKGLSKVPATERPELGKLLNTLKEELELEYAKTEKKLQESELQERLKAEELDLSLPAFPTQMGSLHAVTLVTREMTQVLGRIGFSVRTGPVIESDHYNFTALNIPPEHPAREMQDTFFVDGDKVLRTHTSPIQIHTMENEKPPLRICGVGSVFRCDSDISHLPHFHQVEGMVVDQKVSMADLKGTISFFVKEFFGAQLKTRFRPSFFPFTEPSAEVDCQCPICHGKGCSMCKQSGWVEIGGCGLINPKVLQAAHIQYPQWQGFAFGFGVERMAIIKYQVEDIRLFPSNDLRFLRQFT